MRLIAKNRNAYFNYEILESINAGVVLKGSEVKSIAKNGMDLSESYVTIRNGEAFLLNAHIAHYQSGFFDHEPRQTRQLLLNKQEILKFEHEAKVKKLQIIPIKVFFVNSLIKIEIALARPKKIHDKRETIKKRDLDRLNRN
ncbi:MAG: SsrA-binding protein SmpB [Mycoplasma sp.]